MSAISASQDNRPQFVSVQHLTSRLESAQGADWAPRNSGSGRKNSPSAKSAASGQRKESLPPLRLTRRGRIVLIGIPLVILAAILLSLTGFLTSPAKAADSAADLSVTPTVTVTVQAGQSLWAIAGAAAPARDPRDVIADIVQLNNLTAGGVVPGQQLFVPTQ
jgi:LysM repeat protein